MPGYRLRSHLFNEEGERPPIDVAIVLLHPERPLLCSRNGPCNDGLLELERLRVDRKAIDRGSLCSIEGGKDLHRTDPAITARYCNTHLEGILGTHRIVPEYETTITTEQDGGTGGWPIIILLAGGKQDQYRGHGKYDLCGC